MLPPRTHDPDADGGGVLHVLNLHAQLILSRVRARRLAHKEHCVEVTSPNVHTGGIQGSPALCPHHLRTGLALGEGIKSGEWALRACITAPGLDNFLDLDLTLVQALIPTKLWPWLCLTPTLSLTSPLIPTLTLTLIPALTLALILTQAIVLFLNLTLSMALLPAPALTLTLPLSLTPTPTLSIIPTSAPTLTLSIGPTPAPNLALTRIPDPTLP